MLKSEQIREFNETILGKIYETISETFGQMEGELCIKFHELHELEKEKYLADCEASSSLWNIKEKLNDVSSRLEKNKNSEEFKTTFDNLNDKLKLINTTEPDFEKDVVSIVEFIDNHGQEQINRFQNELGGYHAKILEKRFGEIKSLAEKFIKAEDTAFNAQKNISKTLSDLKKVLEKVQDTKLRNFIMNYADITYNQGVINRVEIIKNKLDRQRLAKISNYSRNKSSEKRENVKIELDKCRRSLFIAKRVIKFYNLKMKQYGREVLGENGDSRRHPSLETLSNINEKSFADRQENQRDSEGRLSLKELVKQIRREEPSSREAEGINKGLTNGYSLAQKRYQPEHEGH